MSSTSVLNLIAEHFDSLLNVAMRDALDQNDETRAGLVRVGLLQDDPIRYGVTVLTHIGDPENEDKWKHTIVGGDDLPFHHPPAYQVGGGEMWHRRFTIELTQFFKPSASRARARTLSQVILSRAEHTIRTSALGLGPDSFGEMALQAYIHSSVNTEAGGEGQYIYHGKIWVVVLTEVNW